MPLVVTHRLGRGPLQILNAPDMSLGRLRNYCGSVAFDASGRVLAVTSPVGGVTAFWNIGDGRFLGVAEQGDVCGLATADRIGEFIVTSGLGGAGRVSAGEPRLRAFSDKTVSGARWDNHLLRVTL